MNCNILLFLGGLLLCLGLYFGLSKSGNLQLVLILLGGSIAAFSVVVVVLLKSHTFGSPDPKKSEPEPAPKATAGIASGLNAKAGVNADTKASGNEGAEQKASAEPAHEEGKEQDSAPKFLSGIEVQVEPVHLPSIDQTSEIHEAADSSSRSGITLLMSTPLGDLLLSALVKDPESAGRFVTQAILQAQASSSIRLK